MVNQVSPNPNMNDNQTAMQNLKQYGGYIISAIILALAGYFGWAYYQNHGGRIDKTTMNDFAKIQSTQDTINSLADQPKLTPDQQKQLADSTAQLQKDIPAFVAAHPNSAYAWQALMLQAHQQTNSNDLKGAADTLKQASQMQLGDAGLEAIATLRYAQALIANGQADEAQTVLNKALPPAFEDAKEELFGDVATAKNDRAGAISHYQKAWSIIEERNKTQTVKQDRAILRLKMEGLGLAPKQPDTSGGVVVKPTVDDKAAAAAALAAAMTDKTVASSAPSKADNLATKTDKSTEKKSEKLTADNASDKKVATTKITTTKTTEVKTVTKATDNTPTAKSVAAQPTSSADDSDDEDGDE